MSELKTRPTAASVSEFLARQTDERRADCEAIARMMEAATGERAEMWGEAIVGFGRYRYKYASGREGDWFLTGFSPRKQNLTLYIIAGFDNYDALLAKLGKHTTGKSCLYLKRLDDVHLPTLKKLVQQSVKHMRQAHPAP